MNILKRIENNVGVKAEQPEFPTSFFPYGEKPYIIIDNRGKVDANIYDLFLDVVEAILPILQKRNIDIFCFCSSDEKCIEFCKPFVNLPPKQEAFLIKNALAVCTTYNLSTYVASALNIPSVCLYSSSPAENLKPIWDDKHIVIESDRLGNHPSYGAEETPKAINRIKPEKVSNVILNLLNIDNKINVETVHVGDAYHTKAAEIIPDFIPEQSFFANKLINIRCDYFYDPEIIAHWLSNRKANLLLDKPIDVNLINYFRSNIIQITVSINDSFSEDWLDKVKKLGIPMQIFCENNSELSNYRFKFFNHIIFSNIYKSKEDLWDPSKYNKSTRFITGKVLISEGKRYSCLSAKKANKPLTNVPEYVYDSEEFWKELDHYRLFNSL